MAYNLSYVTSGTNAILHHPVDPPPPNTGPVPPMGCVSLYIPRLVLRAFFQKGVVTPAPIQYIVGMTHSDPNQLHMDTCIVCGALFEQPVQSGSKKIYCTKRCGDRARLRRHRLRVAGRLPVEMDTAQVFKFSYMYASHKRSAAKRGKSWEISKDEWIKWNEETPQECFYCGMSPETQSAMVSYLYEHRRDRPGISGLPRGPKEMIRLTIDRKDNVVGYRIDNIVRACWFCNSIKGSFVPSHVMVKHAPEIIANMQKALYDSE